MVSQKILVLLAISAALTFVQGHPFGGMMGMRMDDSDGEKDDSWMMDGEKESKDEQMKMMELFMKCLKFLKEKHEEKEKERKLHELFKHFVKSVEALKDFHQMLEEGMERQGAEGDMDEVLKKFFDRDDDDANYGDDYEDRDEKMKKLFFIYMKFKVIMKEMKEKEKEAKEEKLKKQFFVFVKFMKFAKESKTKLEMLGQLSKIIELKFKAKFLIFKKCMTEGRCEMDDDEDKDKGKDWDEGKFHDHIEMFSKMMKYLRGDQGGEYDGMGDGDNYEDKDGDKKDIPILELLMKLHKHVSEHGREFWGDEDLSPEEKMKKFVFFAYKCYKHMQELKAMKEKKAKIMELFYKFSKFLEQHENAAKAKMEYAKFQKWQEEQKNKAKVEEMKNFLKKVAIFKRMLAEKKEQEAKEESMKTFFEKKMKELMEKEKGEKEDMMKKFIDARMMEHMKKERGEKEEMMNVFFKRMKEQNAKQERENKMKAMLQILEHTDL